MDRRTAQLPCHRLALHELAPVLEELTPTEFVKLPVGQRMLILAKLSDIVSSGNPELQFASEQFLTLLLPRGIFLGKEDYREIVGPSIRWGFEMTFEGKYLGRPSIRRSLEQAAYDARADAYEVLREEFVEFLQSIELESKDNWYLQGVRGMLQTLLADPSCSTGADELAAAPKKVNQVQRSRTQSVTREAAADRSF